MNENLTAPATAPTTTPARAKSAAPALGRAAAIMDFLSAAPEAQSLSAISRSLGFAKSSTHALCESLVQLDLLRLEGKCYRLGAKSLTWAQAFSRRSDLLREFHYEIENDALLSPYTVSLSRLEAEYVHYLSSHQAMQPLGITFASGMQLPSVFTASGKAMLAAMAPEQAQSLIPTQWPEPLTAQSVSKEAWPEQLKQWRQLGYGVDHQELRMGLVCIGVAIQSHQGRVLGGLALSMTLQEAEGVGAAHLAQALRRIGTKLSRLYQNG